MKTPAYNRCCTVLDFSQFKRNQQVQMLSFHKNQWEMYLGSAMVHKKKQETHAVVNLPLCYKRIHYGIQQAIKRKQFLQSYAPSNQLYNLLLFWIFVHIRIIVMKFQNKSSLVSQNWMLCHVHCTICIMSKWHRPKRTDVHVILWILEHRYCSKPWVHWLDFSIVTLSNLKYT